MNDLRLYTSRLFTLLLLATTWWIAAPAQAQYSRLLAYDGAADNYYGWSVSISGDTMLVGARSDQENGLDAGSAYIYQWDDVGSFQEIKLLPDDGAERDYFGQSVSVSGDRALIGAYGDDDNGSNSGSAYIFRWNGTDWIQEAKLLPGDGAASDRFGGSVSLSGDRALVGAYIGGDNGVNTGSAYIFQWNGTEWVEEAELLPEDGAASDQFGWSVSLSGDRALIGAGGDDDNGSNSGSTYIFRRNGTDWIQETKLLPGDGAASDRFGGSVSLSGERALVGASGGGDNGVNTGSAYIFQWNGTEWVEEAELLPEDGAPSDQFGWSVSLSGDEALVGMTGDYYSSTSTGAAYVFRRDAAGWVKDAKLLPEGVGASDEYGSSVALSGDVALVGAHGDDDYYPNAGSVYRTSLTPRLSLDASFVSFGDVALGTSVSRDLALTNDGITDLVVDSIRSTNAAFSISPTTLTVAPGRSAYVGVTFTADTIGTSAGELVIAHNGAGNPHSVGLYGIGALPAVRLVPFAETAEVTLPSFVTVAFQATDLQGRGLDFLGETEYYEIRENGNAIDEESIPRVESFGAIPFSVKTVLMLDNSFSIGLDSSLVKDAARTFVDNLFPQQEVAIYTFSDGPVLRQDFTRDADSLRMAINSITDLGSSSTNLYGSVIEGVKQWDDYFRITGSDQGFQLGVLVVFSDGVDTRGTSTEQEALAAIGDKNVVTIGVGTEAQTALSRIHTADFVHPIAAQDFEGLEDAFADIQTQLTNTTNSFYWLNYVSPKREDNDHVLTVGLKNNPNSGEDASFQVGFNSDGFGDVQRGVYINRSVQNLAGADTVRVGAKNGATVTAETLFRLYPPAYTWTPADESLLKIEPQDDAASVVEMTLTGDIGAYTTLTVADTVNNYSKVVVISGVERVDVAQPVDVPAGFKLYANAPNPFRGSTALRYDLPQAGDVHLAVYDVLGRRVAVLVDQRQPAGSHTASFDASSLASGIYFYRLEADNFTAVKKMLHVR